MCVLCKDTFSRSDILKRHFQKCSLRRGNPTGASHLSHPQAHLKRSQAAANAAKSVQEEVSSSPIPASGLGPTQPLGFSMSANGNSFSPSQDQASWMAKQSPYLYNAPPTGKGNNIDRFEQAKPPMVQDPKHRPMMPGQPGQELDWATMFQPAAPDGYMNPVFPQSMAPGHEPIHSHVDPDRKFYPATTTGHQDNGLNGLYLASTSLSGDGMRDPEAKRKPEP